MAEYFSASELAEMFGVAVHTPLNWERAGHFPKSIKIGATRRWRRADVERFIKEQEESANASN